MLCPLVVKPIGVTRRNSRQRKPLEWGRSCIKKHPALLSKMELMIRSVTSEVLVHIHCKIMAIC